jgi:hypothetical protein
VTASVHVRQCVSLVVRHYTRVSAGGPGRGARGGQTLTAGVVAEQPEPRKMISTSAMAVPAKRACEAGRATIRAVGERQGGAERRGREGHDE